jgi:hypothetical protein
LIAATAAMIFAVGVLLLPSAHLGPKRSPSAERTTSCAGTSAPSVACTPRSLAAVARLDAAAVMADVLEKDQNDLPLNAPNLSPRTLKLLAESCRLQSYNVEVVAEGDAGVGYNCITILADRLKRRRRAFRDMVYCGLANSTIQCDGREREQLQRGSRAPGRRARGTGAVNVSDRMSRRQQLALPTHGSALVLRK